jgi:KipI family sensor histidine kinase inhibitor
MGVMRTVPRVIPVGGRACLVEVADGVAAASLAAWARSAGVVADEVVPAATTVLFDGVDPAAVEEVLPDWPGAAAGASGPLVRVPVVYDGPDLDAVADHWGCSAGDVVRLHTSVEFVAVFSGFAPGFSYLAGLPTGRAVPRLATPRSRVAPGSVGLADTWCGVYPTASPGGWLLLGTTDAVLWDPAREQPALLAPGTRVRFTDAGSVAG